MIREPRIIYTTSVDDASEYTGPMALLPVVNQPAHHPGALLHHLARRMRLRTEAVLAPLGLRPRHLVALAALRDPGGRTRLALFPPPESDRANILGRLNSLVTTRPLPQRRPPGRRRR